MSWIDRVLAVPTVGCVFQPEATPWSHHLEALRPLINSALQKGRVANVATSSTMNLEVNFDSGFRYAITHERLVVEFKYPFEFKERPGQMPESTYKVPIQKYTDLLRQTINEESDLLECILGTTARPLGRVGVVASCRIDAASPPPGVATFVKHLQRPWGSSLPKCQAHLVSVLKKTESTREQCHHQIDVEEERENDLRLILDWQRLMLNPLALRASKVREEMGKCVEEALKYFERFGKGELEYGQPD